MTRPKILAFNKYKAIRFFYKADPAKLQYFIIPGILPRIALQQFLQFAVCRKN